MSNDFFSNNPVDEQEENFVDQDDSSLAPGFGAEEVETTPKSTSAIMGFIFSLIGFLSSFISPLLGLIFSVCAILLGIRGLRKTKAGIEEGRTLSYFSIIIGLVGAIISVVLVFTTGEPIYRDIFGLGQMYPEEPEVPEYRF